MYDARDRKSGERLSTLQICQNKRSVTVVGEQSLASRMKCERAKPGWRQRHNVSGCRHVPDLDAMERVREPFFADSEKPPVGTPPAPDSPALRTRWQARQQPLV